MNRLELYKLNGKASIDEEYLSWPEDIKKLRGRIPELVGLPDADVSELYSDWSTAVYAAGWLQLIESGFEEFRSWLLSEADAGKEMYPPDWYWNKQE